MEIQVDQDAGFCSGVIRAVRMAEKDLNEHEKLYCLGEIVHNEAEVNRLSEKGLIFINHEDLKKLHHVKVLIRAHGEPPSIYKIAEENNIELIDASCRVVLHLQDKIKLAWEKLEEQNGQIVIFGRKDHPEVIGLNGKINFRAIIISGVNDLELIDYSKPVFLFAQTTKSVYEFRQIVAKIQSRIDNDLLFEYDESICKQVSAREHNLKAFAKSKDMIVFVGGKKSSNAKFLFRICKEENNKSVFISNINELNKEMFQNVESVGVSGATSTPQWQMEEVKIKIEEILCI